MRKSATVVATSLVLLASLPQSLPIADAKDWAAPLAVQRGLEIQGEPSAWSRLQAKALDPVHERDARDARGDLMGFFYDQEVDRLSFRLNLLREVGTPRSAPVLGEGIRAVVLLDYEEGGSRELPGVAGREAPIAWDRALEIRDDQGQARTRVLDATLADTETERVRRTVASSKWSSLETSLWLPGGFERAVTRAVGKAEADYATVAPAAAASDATPVQFYVYSAADGVLLDDLRASNQPTSNTHNVAFVQHLNQGLTYTTVFRGERGEAAAFDGDPNNPDDGADEILAAHDYYNLPVNWHQGGLLISAAEWHDPGFNDWLLAGVNAGRYEMVTSALGQHIMPFLRDELNGKSVSVENDMIQTRYNFTPRVAWVPERVWVENPDNDGNGIDASAGVIDWIGDDFADNGVWAVILDDYVHCGYNNGAFDDHHVYTYGGIKVLPIDNDFVGQVNWNAGDAWNTLLAGTSDEIILYGNDAEIAAEVSQGANNPNGVNNYIWLLQQIANSAGAVGCWKLTDVLQDPGFTTQALTLQSGTYGLLGEFYGYGGGNNSWYVDWAGYTGASNLDGHSPKWNYGQQWDFTLDKILASPANDINEMAWYVLMTNLHETGWHDAGEISGWQHHYSNHIRSANAHAEAARWAGGLYLDPSGAYTSDFDEDGVDELVLYNDRLLAVFDTIGGKLQWLFCKGVDYAYSVVSNDNAYWVDTDGDYNETNHVAALSDVSVGGVDRENDLYGLEVLTPSGGTVVARLNHADLTKTVSLAMGDPYLKVEYRARGNQVYVKNGFAPNVLDLTWNGKALERVWDPGGGGYFGQRNTNDHATAAIVVGTAGAAQNQQFSATLLEGDEFNGVSPFEVYVYGGYTSPVDLDGHVPELLALRDGLTDTLAPMPLDGIYYPATDRLTFFFDEPVDAASVVVTGFAIDDDDDGLAEVTLTGSDVLVTAGVSSRLDFDLDAATAAALQALGGNLELLLAANSVQDGVGNGNAAITNLDDVPVAVAPATSVQIDGLVTDAEWSNARKRVDDGGDSLWNGTFPDINELETLFIDWDDTYLYIGLRGFVQGNSWILYLDTDVDGPQGETDLTAIDSWERGATFSAPGFAPDFQLGAYQHQGAFDGQSFWQLTSATTSVDLSSSVVMAFDPGHVNGLQGGTELAVPWDVLYGLGAGQVPANATLGVVASVCWDPEPDGELGGDSVPNNVVTTLPDVDAYCEISVDVNGDGQPDPAPTAVEPSVARTSRVFGAFPNPTGGVAEVPLVIAGRAGATHAVRAVVYDLAGRRVATAFDDRLGAGRHTLRWDGRDAQGRATGSGTYFLRVTVDGEAVGTTKIARVH